MTRLLIIDDHAMFRSGLRKVLQDAPEITRIDEAGDWRGGLACLEAAPTDVLLLDINMPDCSGLDLIGPIRERFAALRIIMLSMYSERSTRCARCATARTATWPRTWKPPT